MRICHITTVHPRYDVRIFLKECQSLAKKYHDIHLIVADGKGDEVKDGVHIHDVGKPNGRRQRMLDFPKLAFHKALEINAYAYHFHDPELLPTGVRLRKRGKIVVYDSHEDLPALIAEKEWLPKPFRRIAAHVCSSIEKACVKRLSATVSVTPKVTERLIKINPLTYEITNFPIVHTFSDSRLWEDSVCFAGGISRQWMHETIIKALETNGNIIYNLAGSADSRYLEGLQQLPMWKNVNFVGKLPFSEVQRFLQKSTAGIALNDYVANVGFKEGSLGNTKLFEYMQAGIPVICTDFNLWKKIVHDNNCGICIPPNDPTALANAIQYLTDNKEVAKEMGDKGRQLVETKYNWNTQETVLFQLYETLFKQQS